MTPVICHFPAPDQGHDLYEKVKIEIDEKICKDCKKIFLNLKNHLKKL